MTIGIVALQGGFVEHENMLWRLGVSCVQVRKVSDLTSCHALILPGGESTTVAKFLDEEEMVEALRAFADSGKPMFGTCCGVILLSRLGLLDIEVERNAYGRQLESCIVPLSSRDEAFDGMEGVFIRAPKIVSLDSDVSVLAKRDNDIVLVRQGNILGATFHPELTQDESVHRYFLEIIS